MKQYASWRDVPASEWTWPNFSPREVACKGSGQVLIVPEAMDKLQALRTKLGKPLLITSAYRSPSHNRAVGGAAQSLHLLGTAFDVRMENQDPAEFEAAAKAVGFTGFGHYPRQGFMHIDLGPVRQWGTPFRASLTTSLPVEPEGRASVAQSSTIQASAVQLASGAGTAVTAIQALDGTAQIVALAFAGLIVLAAIWIMRERIKKWSEGIR